MRILLCRAVCEENPFSLAFFELTAQICGIVGKFEFKFDVVLFWQIFTRKFNAYLSNVGKYTISYSFVTRLFIHFCSVDNSRRKFGATLRGL